MRYSKKQAAVAIAAAVVLTSSGVALAYWTTTGFGTGSSTTDTTQPWLVTVDSTTTGDLSPDGPTDTVAFHVKNQGSGVQRLNNTVAIVTSTSNAGCTAADFYAPVTTITYGDVTGLTTVDGTFSLRMKDTGVVQNLCKAVTVNLRVDAS